MCHEQEIEVIQVKNNVATFLNSSDSEFRKIRNYRRKQEYSSESTFVLFVCQKVLVGASQDALEELTVVAIGSG